MADQTSAANLPGGSVVVDDLKGVAYYAIGDPGEEPGGRWEMTMSPCTDSTVDYHLRHGAVVVRIGDQEPPVPPQFGPSSARERLARHFWVADGGDPDTWDERQWAVSLMHRESPRLATALAASFDRFTARADQILAVITGQEN